MVSNNWFWECYVCRLSMQLASPLLMGVTIILCSSTLPAQTTKPDYMLLGVEDVKSITEQEAECVKSLFLSCYSPSESSGFGDMTDELIVQAVRKFKNLEDLRITTNPWCFSGRSLLQLKSLNSLRSLQIGVNYVGGGRICLAPDFFTNFGKISKRLKKLDLEGVQLDQVDNLEGFINEFKELEFLGLVDCNLDDSHLVFLGNLERLNAIDLRKNRFSFQSSREFTRSTDCKFLGMGSKDFLPVSVLDAVKGNSAVHVVALDYDPDNLAPTDRIMQVAAVLVPDKKVTLSSLSAVWPDHFENSR